MIRNMVMVYTHGQMAEHIQATGAEVNNMVQEHIVCQVNRLSTDYGKKANVLNGLMKNRLIRFNGVSQTIKSSSAKQRVDLMLIHLQISECQTTLTKECKI